MKAYRECGTLAMSSQCCDYVPPEDAAELRQSVSFINFLQTVSAQLLSATENSSSRKEVVSLVLDIVSCLPVDDVSSFLLPLVEHCQEQQSHYHDT